MLSFAAALPSGLRLRGGEGKRLLRRAVSGHVPPLLLMPRPREEAIPGAAAAVTGRFPALAETGWFDMRAIGRILEDDRGRATSNPWIGPQLALLDQTLAGIGVGAVRLAG